MLWYINVQVQRNKLVILCLLPRRQQRKSWEHLKGQLVLGPWIHREIKKHEQHCFLGSFQLWKLHCGLWIHGKFFYLGTRTHPPFGQLCYCPVPVYV